MDLHQAYNRHCSVISKRAHQQRKQCLYENKAVSGHANDGFANSIIKYIPKPEL